MNLRRWGFLLFAVLSAIGLRAQCTSGEYLYYFNIGNSNLSNSYSTEDFQNHLIGLGLNGKIGHLVIAAEKSFKNPNRSLFLQQSVTVIASDAFLLDSLGPDTSQFNLVEYVGCNGDYVLTYIPNDYSLGGGDAKSHLELIRAKEAWDITTGDSRVVIGITDEGIDPNHEEFSGKLTVYSNSSTHAHGTSVTSVAAAQGDNGKGLPGVAYDCSIAFRTMGVSNVDAISMVSGVRVINMSWFNGGSTSSPYNSSHALFFQELRDIDNIVVVGGAGNGVGHNSGNPVYPPAYAANLTVTSVGHLKPIGTYWSPNSVYCSTFSCPSPFNWMDVHDKIYNEPVLGNTHSHYAAVDLMAPGYEVYCAYPGNTYGGATGTSYAAPQVAGVCALVISLNPCLTAQEVQDIVKNTSNPTPLMLPENSAYSGQLGVGRLDAYEAVKRALELGTIYVQNTTYSSTTTENAEVRVMAGYNVDSSQPYGLVTIQANSDVTFEATHSIILSEGFTVQNNADFEAKIVDSACW